MSSIEIPLARCADEVIGALAKAADSMAIAKLDGQTLLGERAMLAGFHIPQKISAGGGCRLFQARRDCIALSLARDSDRELLPALFELESIDTRDDHAIQEQIARCDPHALLARGRSMGLAIAAEHELVSAPAIAWTELIRGLPARDRPPRPLRVVDLSALWAGPLASHLLWLAGAEVIKVESRSRPDAMRDGDATFYSLLNQGKSSVALDFKDAADRRALLSLLQQADIVIEAARPRALQQLGIDAAEIVRTTPGLVWITITGHGAEGDAANWVGFGDDCGVAGGLSAALRTATGRMGFVGDAIADPLTGMFAAMCAWNARRSHTGGRFGVAMSQIVAYCLKQARDRDVDEFTTNLNRWAASVGEPFPVVARRSIGSVAAFGEHTRSILARCAPC